MLDWDDLRVFLAVARHGTLAAAARDLRVTQSTVGRRLGTLQSAVGVRLLQRTPDGYVLTAAGKAILEHVERVESGALSVERAISGHDATMSGTVRLTSSQLITSHLVAPCVAGLHARNRSITIELLPTLPGDPLASLEADVAVQLQAFHHQDLVIRKIGSIAFGLYGCVAYLARCGMPDTNGGCAGHQIITSLDDRELTAQAAWLSEHAGRGEVVLRSDSYETQHWTTACGGGLAILPRFRADAEPALHRIGTHVPVPSADIWLGVHRENRDVPRVRAVLDCVAEAVRSRASVLHPEG